MSMMNTTSIRRTARWIGAYRLSHPIQTLLLLFGVLSLHCASTVPYNTITLPCSIESSKALHEAQQHLARLGFQQKVFLPDSGYFRTKAMKTGSVATSASGKPSWYVFEVIHKNEKLSVRAFNLIPKPNSEAMKFNVSPEDESGTEENPVMPGDRFHMMIVEPFIDHMKNACEKGGSGTR